MNSPRFLAALLMTTAAFAAENTAPKISPAEAAKLVDTGKAVLVDCREPAEWAESGVAKQAVLLPKSDFDGEKKQWKEFLAANKGKQVILYCRSGGRAGTIATALAKEGMTTANAGGFKDWTAAGLPTRPANEKPSASGQK
jgi:rhodanese-related sulfurtransferase